MKPHFLIATILIVATLSLAAAPAAAQVNETDDLDPDLVDELDDDQCEAPTPIDQNTVLCSAELEDGEAVLVLRSDRLQSITITDMGSMFEGGQVPRSRHQIRADEPNTVRVPVTYHRNMAGVSIDTGPALHAVPLDDTSPLIGPPWSASDVQLGAIAAGLSTAGVAGLVVLRTIYGRTEEPERIA